MQEARASETDSALARLSTVARVLLACALPLAACTRVVDAPPVAQLAVAPIAEAQVRDLLSEEAQKEPVVVSVYERAEPAECAGLVQEANAPLIFDAKPAVNDGGFWFDGGAKIIEIVGVYRANYRARVTIDGVRRTVDACRAATLVSYGDDDSITSFRLSRPIDTGSPDIAVWSLTAPDPWTCDNALTAAYNAAVLITACSKAGGYDVLTLARKALDRINALADSRA